MGKRRDMIRKCALVRDLLQENQFTAALELMDELPLEEVVSVEDLYLFADLYEKAERMDKKKEIFYLIYERTKSRHILNRLLRLVLRMGDMAEARELFLAYEFGNDVTLDTFELRYLIARAEGESRSALIHILEELKAEEYTEEWGYQLARLYEQEGMREECIRECRDLQLWFGEGTIVEKARELQAGCESPDWVPPRDEEIPEPEEPERDEIIAYAAHPVKVTDLGKTDEEEEPEEKIVFMEPEIDRDSLREAVSEVVEAVAAERKSAAAETFAAATKTFAAEENTYRPSGELPEEGVSEVRKTPKPKKQEDMPVEEAVLQDEQEDISERGIRYLTLKGTINQLRQTRQEAHFVFAGGEERITLAVAKRITKELNHVGYFSAGSIVKIAADKLNELKLEEQMERLSGRCMLVTNASEMNYTAVRDLFEMMEEKEDQVVVMLSGPFDEMDCFLANHMELSDKLTYKVRM